MPRPLLLALVSIVLLSVGIMPVDAAGYKGKTHHSTKTHHGQPGPKHPKTCSGPKCHK